MIKRKYAITTFSILTTFLFSFSADISCAEGFPAIDPPTAEISLEPVGIKRANKAVEFAGTPTTEWVYHKTADNLHPNGMEQQQLWFVNRARSHPTNEGVWLASETHPDVKGGRDYFSVDLNMLQSEFAAISAMPPAAFDRRLYEAAKTHSNDLIARDAQDHTGQFELVTASGFKWSALGGVVYSYTKSALHAHAGFNIDWGPPPANDPNDTDGMQNGRGHRVALMSDNKEFTNVGIASIYVTDTTKNVGPYVTTGNYAKANYTQPNHSNTFIVGTVWSDTNTNGQYDAGEGHAGVTVTPSIGTHYAVTGVSGGYAIPITQTGTAKITFSGGVPSVSGNINTTLATSSKLVDFTPGTVTNGKGFPWLMLLL